MNSDFHYYGTYAAARLAGYSGESAKIIAYAAQYVDDSDIEQLKYDKNNYYIKDFTPVPTVQTPLQLYNLTNIYNGTAENIDSSAKIWVPFHFLPGNYPKALPKNQEYDGYLKYNDWQYDEEACEQFKLLCLPNSILAQNMINNIKGSDNLHMIGLRMHVLADTWAHMYYAGIPAWFINDVNGDVFNITDNDQGAKINWTWGWPESDRFNLHSCTPPMSSYTSYVYLGHGRMGHIPDYPWIKYKYRPNWSKSTITKDNTVNFMCAFKQMVNAMFCIKNNNDFNINANIDIDSENEKAITTILKTQVNDQSELWKEYMKEKLELPKIYNKNEWLNEMKESSDIKLTNYYKFNQSALLHLKFVEDSLKENSLFLDETPEEKIVKVSLKNQANSLYIGHLQQGKIYNYPEARKNYIGLTIVKPNTEPLRNGSIVKIKTTEKIENDFSYLGAWSDSKSLYYYLRDYSITKQKWEIEKLDGDEGEEIKKGDTIRIKNIYFQESDPYVTTYSPTNNETYLTTSRSTDEDSKWTINIL